MTDIERIRKFGKDWLRWAEEAEDSDDGIPLGDQVLLARFALRTLGTMKEVRKILESPCGIEQRRLVLAELAKFDEKEVKSK